jgi:hypothetical protein
MTGGVVVGKRLPARGETGMVTVDMLFFSA